MEFIFNCYNICNQIFDYAGLYFVNKWYEIVTNKTKLPSFFNLHIDKDLNDYYLKKIIDWHIQNGDLLDPETRLISLDIKESAIKEQFRRNIPIGMPIYVYPPHIIQMTAEPAPPSVRGSARIAVTALDYETIQDKIEIVIGKEKETDDSYYNYDFIII